MKQEGYELETVLKVVVNNNKERDNDMLVE